MFDESRWVLAILVSLMICPAMICSAADSLAAQAEAPPAPAERPQADQDTGAHQDAAKQDGGGSKTKFIRFRDVGESEGVLETAVVTYRHEDGTEVDLVSVVHIADADYYRQLNKLFKGYDAVLYEMIKPKDVDPARRSSGAISFLQRTMKNVLELSFQLDAIDYKAKNLVHADMTPTSFSRAQRESGESLFGILFKSAMKQWKSQLGGGGSSMGFGEILNAIMSDDTSKALKYVFGKEMRNIDQMMSAMEDSVIIAGRNKVAMNVLQAERAQGKKKLAIFYGGGHMPDFERRLAALGMKKAKTTWMSAWDIRSEETKAKEKAAAAKKRREV